MSELKKITKNFLIICDKPKFSYFCNRNKGTRYIDLLHDGRKFGFF
jgi:hypothetical protein